MKDSVCTSTADCATISDILERDQTQGLVVLGLFSHDGGRNLIL